MKCGIMKYIKDLNINKYFEKQIRDLYLWNLESKISTYATLIPTLHNNHLVFSEVVVLHFLGLKTL